jgi:hypothetical protein
LQEFFHNAIFFNGSNSPFLELIKLFAKRVHEKLDVIKRFIKEAYKSESSSSLKRKRGSQGQNGGGKAEM